MLNFFFGFQDLVEALSVKNSWFIPRKYDQATWERSPDGHYAGFEEIVPFGKHSPPVVKSPIHVQAIWYWSGRFWATAQLIWWFFSRAANRKLLQS